MLPLGADNFSLLFLLFTLTTHGGDDDVVDLSFLSFMPSNSISDASRLSLTWVLLSRISLRILMYFMAIRSVVILVSFSLVVCVGDPATITGTDCLNVSKAWLISRIRVRSLAFAVFLRYFDSGAARCFGFSFATFSLTVVKAVNSSSAELLMFALPLLLPPLTAFACLLVIDLRWPRCRSEYFSFFLIVRLLLLLFSLLLFWSDSIVTSGDWSIVIECIISPFLWCIFQETRNLLLLRRWLLQEINEKIDY